MADNESLAERLDKAYCRGWDDAAKAVSTQTAELLERSGREREDLEARVEQLEEALRDVLDVVEGWCSPMSEEERLPAIQEFASQALSGLEKGEEGDAL